MGTLAREKTVGLRISFWSVTLESSGKQTEDRIHGLHLEDAHLCEEIPAHVASDVSVSLDFLN